MVRARLAAAAISFLAIALAPAGPVSAASRAPAAPDSAQVANGSWTVYHRDNAHTGFDSSQSTVTGIGAGWTTALDGQTYVEPLIYNGFVYVATLNNTVYALHQADGTVAWSTNLGAPQTSGWACGNVSSAGILGTPVIDTVGGRIYVVAFRHLELSYYMFGLDLNTGAVVVYSAVSSADFDWTIQQERGALALSADRSHVYIPMGGRFGDCGNYHGYVFGAGTTGNNLPLEEFETPGSGSGMWAAGGVVVDDSTGKVLVTTGNGDCPSSYDNLNDAVVGLSPTLGLQDYFAPQDWHDVWSCPDEDLGSISTVLISPTLAFATGKAGYGFLVNPQNLGGIDGQLYPTPAPSTYGPVDACHGNHHDATFGSIAYAAPYVYLSCDGQGLVALKVYPATPSFTNCDATCASPSWHTAAATFGPPIVAGGVVFVVDTNGTGLYGFDAATGTKILQTAGFSANHFTTPATAGGQIFVASGTTARAFTLLSGCSGLSVTAPGEATIGTTVAVTGTATGCPHASPSYQFWLLPPGGAWSIVQPYSTNASYSWNTTGLAAGSYEFSVWARDSGSTTQYDVYKTAFITLSQCASVALTDSPPSAAMRGTVVTLTATSTSGCSSPTYRFWILGPANGGVWTMVQDYSASNTYTWNTSPTQTTGTYRFSVWLRDASSTAAYNAYDASAYYNLTPGCPSVGETSSPPLNAPAGTTVTITATSSGCPNPRYQFWILGPASGGVWTLVLPYGTGNTYTWNTSATQTKGTYRFSVWVRDASSSASYDAYAANEYFNLT
ncbi:MAG TPA: PQQ-binding-like beta-propeller repeat protein [Candidatus Dormibacteraeota bacterium]|nr:PQQ-binding-like beta-propeller repeat protein [Candidatus Dormibacteraeota bacterium]